MRRGAGALFSPGSSFLEGCPHFTMVPEWAVLSDRDIHPSPSTLRAHSIYTNNWEFLGGRWHRY